MQLRAVLFDLDGTLLPMDQDAFLKDYFGRLCRALATRGYDPKNVADSLWQAVFAMIRNDGSRLNEEVFWETFSSLCGERILGEMDLFDTFYATEFQKVRATCGFAPQAAAVVDRLKAAGVRVVLATNPVFPTVATESRIRWAGLQYEDFEWVTTYANIGFCKPNPAYYRAILDRLGLQGEECLMVGNDVSEDMVARDLGMQVFLLTDCLINKKEKDLSLYPHGDFAALSAHLTALGVAE